MAPSVKLKSAGLELIIAAGALPWLANVMSTVDPPEEPFVSSKSESERRIVMKNNYKESRSRIEQMDLYQFSNPPNKKMNVDDLTDILIKNGFRESDIGRQLLSYAEEEDGIEKAIAFVSIIIKAKRARLKKDKEK